MTVERITITDRATWLALREHDVTASVAGALLGVHPYATAYGLYLLKKKLISEDPEETAPMRRGRLLEPIAVQMLREDRPDWSIHEHPVGIYYREPESRIGATPDVLAFNEHNELGVVQIKSVEPSIFRRDWKTEDGTVEPPLWIVCQAIIEAYLTGAKWAAVAPMVISFGIEMPIIPIPIHGGIIERIKGEVAGFWKRVEEGRQYDPDYGRDGAMIMQLYPQDDGSEIDLGGDNELPEFVDGLVAARASKRDAEAREKTCKTAITEKMGAAAIARLADGRRVSNKTTFRKAYAVGATEFRMMKILGGL